MFIKKFESFNQLEIVKDLIQEFIDENNVIEMDNLSNCYKIEEGEMSSLYLTKEKPQELLSTTSTIQWILMMKREFQMGVSPTTGFVTHKETKEFRDRVSKISNSINVMLDRMRTFGFDVKVDAQLDVHKYQIWNIWINE
jgi:hypothetical protein